MNESGDDFTFLPPLDPQLRQAPSNGGGGHNSSNTPVDPARSPVPVPTQRANYERIEERLQQQQSAAAKQASTARSNVDAHVTATVTTNEPAAAVDSATARARLPNVAELEPPKSRRAHTHTCACQHIVQHDSLRTRPSLLPCRRPHHRVDTLSESRSVPCSWHVRQSHNTCTCQRVQRTMMMMKTSETRTRRRSIDRCTCRSLASRAHHDSVGDACTEGGR